MISRDVIDSKVLEVLSTALFSVALLQSIGVGAMGALTDGVVLAVCGFILLAVLLVAIACRYVMLARLIVDCAGFSLSLVSLSVAFALHQPHCHWICGTAAGLYVGIVVCCEWYFRQ